MRAAGAATLRTRYVFGGDAEIHAEQAPAQRQRRQHQEQPQRAGLAEQRPNMQQAAHHAQAKQIVECTPAAVGQFEAQGGRQPQHEQQHPGPAQATPASSVTRAPKPARRARAPVPSRRVPAPAGGAATARRPPCRCGGASDIAHRVRPAAQAQPRRADHRQQAADEQSGADPGDDDRDAAPWRQTVRHRPGRAGQRQRHQKCRREEVGQRQTGGRARLQTARRRAARRRQVNDAGATPRRDDQQALEFGMVLVEILLAGIVSVEAAQLPLMLNARPASSTASRTHCPRWRAGARRRR